MAAINIDDWIPEPKDSRVIQRIRQMSGIERFARRDDMTALTKSTPRSLGADVEVVPKSTAYGEDATPNDDVVLRAIKFGKVFRLAEEDLADSPVATVRVKQRDWATSYAKMIDNAAVATTAAGDNGEVPFDSVYYTLSQTDSDLGYTAGANIIQSDGAVTYDQLSDLLSLYEEGDYFDPSNTVVLAHPGFRGILRKIKDDEGTPIFVQGQGADSGSPDTLFDFPVAWSLGLRTSATATPKPTGNRLLLVANRDLLILGVRSGPESVFIDGRGGVAALTDESILKMRARRGFAVGHPGGMALLEQTEASGSGSGS